MKKSTSFVTGILLSIVRTIVSFIYSAFIGVMYAAIILMIAAITIPIKSLVATIHNGNSFMKNLTTIYVMDFGEMSKAIYKFFTI